MRIVPPGSGGRSNGKVDFFSGRPGIIMLNFNQKISYINDTVTPRLRTVATIEELGRSAIEFVKELFPPPLAAVMLVLDIPGQGLQQQAYSQEREIGLNLEDLQLGDPKSLASFVLTQGETTYIPTLRSNAIVRLLKADEAEMITTQLPVSTQREPIEKLADQIDRDSLKTLNAKLEGVLISPLKGRDQRVAGLLIVGTDMPESLHAADDIIIASQLTLRLAETAINLFQT